MEQLGEALADTLTSRNLPPGRPLQVNLQAGGWVRPSNEHNLFSEKEKWDSNESYHTPEGTENKVKRKKGEQQTEIITGFSSSFHKFLIEREQNFQ